MDGDGQLTDARTYRTAVALRLDNGEQVDEAGRATLAATTAALIGRIHRDHLAARCGPAPGSSWSSATRSDRGRDRRRGRRLHSARAPSAARPSRAPRAPLTTC